METLSAAIVPLILVGAALFALFRGVELYPALTAGIRSGLETVLSIFPSVAAILCAVYMFRASGAMDAFVRLLEPITAPLGIPPETTPLLIIRPLSGSGALAAASDIINGCGPDSTAGRIAAVMLGSTETTFYTVAVYFGAAGIKRSRHTVPAALIADLTGFVCASLFVRLLM